MSPRNPKRSSRRTQPATRQASTARPASATRTPSQTRTPPRIPQLGADRELVTGVRASLAVLRTRREDILRVCFNAAVRQDLAELLSFAAAERMECTDLSDAELSRIADSNQHEGVCIETKPRRWTPPKVLAERLIAARGVAVAFDRVRNPYNIGAIIRSAAFFGIDAAILGMPAPHPALTSQAVRVAEGGAEHLLLTRTTDLADTLARLRSVGVSVIGAEDDGAHNAVGYTFKRPCVLVLGHEREGISQKVRAQCDAMVAIAGAGSVHSLNVSIAASVLLSEIQRGRLGSK